MLAKKNKIIEEQTVVETSNQPRFPSTLIIIVLVLLLGLLTIATGFFFSQNLRLKQQAALSSKPLASSSNQPTKASPTGQTQTVKEVPYGDENLDTDQAYQKAMQEFKDPGPYGWKEFTTKDGKYSLKYPPDWTLEDKSAYIDLYNDGNKKFAQEISITKGQYSFNSLNPLAWGPNVCLYPDSPPYQGPGEENIEKEYTEVKGIQAIYRRPNNSNYSQPPNLKWWICQKEAESNHFTSAAGFGQIWYETPKQYDPVMLMLTDQILASLTTNK